MVWVSYTKLNEAGKSYLAYPNYSICYLLGVMQAITSQYDARCKQVYEGHIQIVHIFLINFHIKYFVFRLTNQKLLILQDSIIFCQFLKNREIGETFLTKGNASLGG
jgi:hypothetical protein